MPPHGIGWKRARAAKDRRADTCGLEYVPDCRSSAQIDSLGGQKSVFLFVAIQAEIGQIGPGIAAQEVKNPVSSRVGPRRKCGPGYRGLGRARGSNPGKPASLSQPSQVRKLARFEQPRDNVRVQTIQTQDDDLLDDPNLPVVSMTGITAAAVHRSTFQITHSLPPGVKP